MYGGSSRVDAFVINNKALHGGGGAVFWEEEPPANIDLYVNESASNTALFGDFCATPAQKLVAVNRSRYSAVSGHVTKDPITMLLVDRFVFTTV